MGYEGGTRGRRSLLKKLRKTFVKKKIKYRVCGFFGSMVVYHKKSFDAIVWGVYFFRLRIGWDRSENGKNEKG